MWKYLFGRREDSVASNVPDANRARDRKPSPSIYGSGAWRPRLSLPPLTRYTTSSPTGSSDPGPWATPATLTNRPRSHGQ